MHNRIHTIIFGFLFLLASLQSAWADLKLPEKEKANAVTAAADLGSNENGLGLKAGTIVAPFESRTHEGKSITLAQLLGQGPLMVIFYRGGWCPYCNHQVRQVTEAYGKFRQRNVTPVLISVDKPDGAVLVKQSYEIPFPVLSDSRLAALTAFNAAVELDADTYERYRGYGADMEDWSGQDHHTIAAPAIHLVGKDGRVLWSHVTLDFKTRPSIEQLLSVIDNNL